MRRLLALLFLCCASMPAQADDDTLAPDAETRWISFTLTPAEQIRFSALVDGRPVHAILDTGVSNSVLSRRFVDAAALRVRSGRAALAIGGAVASGWVDLDSLAVGAFTRLHTRVMTVALPESATGDPAIELLVGRDVIEGYALDIDYAAQRFRLLPSGRLPFTGSVAPLRIAGTWPTYVTELKIGARTIPRMAVDTGDGSTVTVTRAAWRALPEAQRPTSSTIAYGAGGTTVVDVAIVDGVRSGTGSPRAVELRIEADHGYTATIGMNGRIGSGFLRGYRVLLDPRAGRMVLQPTSPGAEPPIRSTSGLLLRREPDRLTVLHVMRGGPAAASGWRVGEQICAVDGVAVTGGGALSWPIDSPGRTLQLALCDGATRTLTLREFY